MCVLLYTDMGGPSLPSIPGVFIMCVLLYTDMGGVGTVST